MLRKLDKKNSLWDMVIIGGGATGLGTAVDAASRGYRTLLLEAHDFGKGTSSRSTKLAHGGVRYLQQGDISLVLEALKERGLMMQNAPHLVKNQAFIIPTYEWWDGPFYTVGLKVYDWMSGKLGIGSSKRISKEETMAFLPTIDQKGLNGGVIYYDGQFDDARFALSLAQTAVRYNATVLNYVEVTALLKSAEGMVCGLKARDKETEKMYEIAAKVVINATGVFSDAIKKMDEPKAKPMIQPSQGIHLVVDKKFLPDRYAIMVPQTKDDRVMFAVPWYDKVLLGTTDTPVKRAELEPKALNTEIDFILETVGQYLQKPPNRSDVRSIFSGLRPLAKPEETTEGKATKAISRHHKVLVSLSGLVTVVGGKWTTYRKMAKDAVNNAALIGGLPERRCITKNLPLYGFDKSAKKTDEAGFGQVYGTDWEKILSLEEDDQKLAEAFSDKFLLRRSQVVWAVRHEMARTLEDMLARRFRGLFLDAQESMRIAKPVAETMRAALNTDEEWVKQQLNSFEKLAAGYCL